MAFIKNIWYVAAWSYELGADKPIGRVIASEPIALYRKADGSAVAVEDRCAHRHAPMSMGRIEGDDLRCMYHGILYGSDGHCKAIPAVDALPAQVRVRSFPVLEKGSWIWVWLGDPAKADPGLIAPAVGLDHPDWIMTAGVLDYEADYQLINDNLCDLSHIDFVHDTTLHAASGANWANDQPEIINLDNGLLIERWFPNAKPMSDQASIDLFVTYHYLLPGIFLMWSSMFPPGTAEASNFKTPNATPFYVRCEQQAVTPISENRARYLFATGGERAKTTQEMLDGNSVVVNNAFAEDRAMIEGQQRIWNMTPPDRQMAFIPQDKAPAMLRRKITKLLAEENTHPA